MSTKTKLSIIFYYFMCCLKPLQFNFLNTYTIYIESISLVAGCSVVRNCYHILIHRVWIIFFTCSRSGVPICVDLYFFIVPVGNNKQYWYSSCFLLQIFISSIRSCFWVLILTYQYHIHLHCLFKHAVCAIYMRFWSKCNIILINISTDISRRQFPSYSKKCDTRMSDLNRWIFFPSNH